MERARRRPASPFGDLPIELALRILLKAARDQSTYRSLVLTSHRVRNLIRFEALPDILYHLSRADQLPAFLHFLNAHPAPLVADAIRFLWIIPDHAGRVQQVCAQIIEKCTNLVSLACHYHVFKAFTSSTSDLLHKKCVDLTLMDLGAMNDFTHLVNVSPRRELVHSLDRLHVISSLDHHRWPTPFPRLEKISRFSIAIGSSSVVKEPFFHELVRSPKLERVVVTTRSRGNFAAMLMNKVRQIDRRFSVLYRRNRWTELSQWKESAQDPDKFWNQAAAEKDAFFSPVTATGTSKSATRRRRNTRKRFAKDRKVKMESHTNLPLLQSQIMEYLKARPSSEEGCHVDEIRENLGADTTETSEALDKLLSVGLLFNTIDDFHYAIVV